MVDQNINVFGGDINDGLYRIRAKKPMLAKAFPGNTKYDLNHSDVEKLDEQRFSELGKSLGIALAFGAVFGALSALKKRVIVSVTMRDGKRFLGETSPRGYALLCKYASL